MDTVCIVQDAIPMCRMKTDAMKVKLATRTVTGSLEQVWTHGIWVSLTDLSKRVYQRSRPDLAYTLIPGESSVYIRNTPPAGPGGRLAAADLAAEVVLRLRRPAAVRGILGEDWVSDCGRRLSLDVIPSDPGDAVCITYHCWEEVLAASLEGGGIGVWDEDKRFSGCVSRAEEGEQ